MDTIVACLGVHSLDVGAQQHDCHQDGAENDGPQGDNSPDRESSSLAPTPPAHVTLPLRSNDPDACSVTDVHSLGGQMPHGLAT